MKLFRRNEEACIKEDKEVRRNFQRKKVRTTKIYLVSIQWEVNGDGDGLRYVVMVGWWMMVGFNAADVSVMPG
jgi:hypothetical protein